VNDTVIIKLSYWDMLQKARGIVEDDDVDSSKTSTKRNGMVVEEGQILEENQLENSESVEDVESLSHSQMNKSASVEGSEDVHVEGGQTNIPLPPSDDEDVPSFQEDHSPAPRLSVQYEFVNKSDVVGTISTSEGTSPVHTIEKITSHPSQPNIQLLSLSGFDSLVPSNHVTLLSTRQNRLRHQYNWLLFLYLDLCNSLNQNLGEEVLAPNASQSEDIAPIVQAITPDESVLLVLRSHASNGQPIQRLSLADKNLTDHDVLPVLFLVKRLRHLVRLDLSGNQLTWRFCENLVQCLSGQAGAKQTAHFGLSELDISFNKDIGNKGAQFLADGLSSKYCSLHYLNLEQTGITAEGCDLILQAIVDNPNSVLVKLNLRQCGVSDDQIGLALNAARKRSSFCFFEAYPHVDQSVQKKSVSWLSMKGWNAYAALRDTLSTNMDAVKEDPRILQPTLYDESHGDNKSKNLVEFLSYINQTYISKLFVDTMDGDPIHAEAARLPFQEWRAAQKRHEEWKNWQHDDQDFESYFSDDSPPKVSRTVSGEWLVVEPTKDQIASPHSTLQQQHHERVSSFDTDMIKLRTRGLSSSENVSSNSLSASTLSVSEPHIECKICFEDKPAKDIYIIDQCEHKFCASCIQAYVACKIKSFETDSIKCPSCQRHMEQSEIRQILSMNSASAQEDEMLTDEELFKKYTDFTLKKALMKMKGLIWCPNTECKNAVLFKGPEVPKRQRFHKEQQITSEGSISVVDNELPPLNTAESSDYWGLHDQQHKEQRVSERLLKKFYPGFFDHQYRFDAADLEEKPLKSSQPQGVGSVSKEMMRRFYSSNDDLQNVEENHVRTESTRTPEEPEDAEEQDTHDEETVEEFPSPLPAEQYHTFRVQCSECKTLICGMCKSFFHPKQSCEEYKHDQAQSAERKALDEWIKEKDAKNCPQCKCVIEKRFGCNHLTCKNCNCEFCWLCQKVLVGDEVKNHFSIIGVNGCKKWNMTSIFAP